MKQTCWYCHGICTGECLTGTRFDALERPHSQVKGNCLQSSDSEESVPSEASITKEKILALGWVKYGTTVKDGVLLFKKGTAVLWWEGTNSVKPNEKGVKIEAYNNEKHCLETTFSGEADYQKLIELSNFVV